MVLSVYWSEICLDLVLVVQAGQDQNIVQLESIQVQSQDMVDCAVLTQAVLFDHQV